MHSRHEKVLGYAHFALIKKKKYIVFDKHNLRRFNAIVLVHKLMKLQTVKTKVIHVH